jgi:lipopolysaccharide transport system ATP-binding protein
MKPAIRITNVSKLYRLGELQHHWTIGDKLAALFSRRAPETNGNGQANGTGQPNGNGRGARNGAGQPDEIWALKDVSFDVAPGEVVGIIGRNGAGKSTLLKILSRITEPTTGQIELHGRVSSLLEVGTGFHPELTGRDNIYLNGSVLGMRKAEIDRKFDEIVDFSGVERFLDTPVKRYSSGMQVRLAFAVAAHLEPEILIVDEVLAVGDAQFQRKCLGKMSEVATGGRTVLFVSHNMAAVDNLCTRGLVLNSGELSFDGETPSAMRCYMSTISEIVADIDLLSHPCRHRPHSRGLVRVQIIDRHGAKVSRVPIGESVIFKVETQFDKPMTDVRCALHIHNETGSRVLTLHTYIQSTRRFDVQVAGTFICHVPELPLLPGRYSVIIGLTSGRRYLDRVEPAIHFDVFASDFFGSGRLPRQDDGVFAAKAIWELD